MTALAHQGEGPAPVPPSSPREGEMEKGLVHSPSAHPQPATVRPEPYQPGSGLEGADFMAAYCDRCQHDQAFRDGTGDSCPIAANTMVFTPEDDAYPREWIYGADDEPTCTAFRPTTPVETDAVGTSGASEPSNSHLIAHLQSLTLALHIGGLDGLRTGRVKMGGRE